MDHCLVPYIMHKGCASGMPKHVIWAWISLNFTQICLFYLINQVALKITCILEKNQFSYCSGVIQTNEIKKYLIFSLIWLWRRNKYWRCHFRPVSSIRCKVNKFALFSLFTENKNNYLNGASVKAAVFAACCLLEIKVRNRNLYVRLPNVRLPRFDCQYSILPIYLVASTPYCQLSTTHVNVVLFQSRASFNKRPDGGPFAPPPLVVFRQ